MKIPMAWGNAIGIFAEIQVCIEMDHTQIVKAVKSAQDRRGNSVIAANDKGDCFFGKDFPNGRLAVLKAAGLLGM